MSRPFKKNHGSVLVEFSFSMVFTMIMIFGAIGIFWWAGTEFAERQKSHEQTLTGTPGDPMLQIDPMYHKSRKFQAVKSFFK